MKKLLSLAATAGMIAACAIPSYAATATGSVKVQWNIQSVGTLNVYANYGGTLGTPTQNTATVPTIINSYGTTAGANNAYCAGAKTVAGPPATVDFGNVTPSGTAVTACDYQNAVAVVVNTNSASWTVSQQLTTALTGGLKLCALQNTATAGTYAWPYTSSQWVAAAATNIPTSAYSATTIVGTGADGIGGGACPSAANGGQDLTAATAVSTIGSQTSGANVAFGEDLGLIFPTNAATSLNTQSGDVLTFTLTYT